MPNRILKESICFSEDIDLLTPEEEIFFYRLIVNCDDYGRFDARPQLLKARLFPLKDNITIDNINECLYKLQELKILALYENNGIRYLQLLNWEKHQQVRAKRSKYPAIDDQESILISHDIICNQVNTYVPENPYPNPIRESESNPNHNPQKMCVPFDEIKNEFNKTCESLAKITSLSKKRKDKIKQRWHELKTLEKFKELFCAVEKCKFLKGDNKNGWKATFDWLIDNDTNYVRVLEGQYTSTSPPIQKITIPQHVNFQQRQCSDDEYESFYCKFDDNDTVEGKADDG